MDLYNLLSILLSSSAFITIIGSIVHRRQRSRIEELNADARDVEVSKETRQLLLDVQNDLNERIKENRALIRGVEGLRAALFDIRSKMFALIEITETQIERKGYAESNICTRSLCTLRTPPIGEFKSSSSRSVIQELKESLRQELENSNQDGTI